MIVTILQLRRTYATIIPTTSVPTFSPPTVNHPRVKERIRIGHLPTHLATRFDAIFSPHLRMIFGKTHLWEMPNDKHLKQVWATVFTEEAPLDFDTPLGLMVHKLIVDRLSSWRHNIGSAGLLALQSKVFSTLQGSDVVKARSKWCTWAVSRTEGDHPFYFASIVEDSDAVGHNFTLLQGIFQSKLISAILGTYINGIMPLRLNIKTDRPVGALVMAIQSVRIYVFFFCVATTRLFCRQNGRSCST
ncbi:hypothetical protein EI94DRAFT_1621774 [Lactarius quietus]|nr:hypothetical protein EI94DRAFT_1621774 [Lactarius quietus]